jgi:putative ABC transport system permease protein
MSTSNYVVIAWYQVGLTLLCCCAAGLVLSRLRTKLERQLLWALTRMVVQLSAIGFVLQWVFGWDHIGITLSCLSTLIASLAAIKRIRRHFRYDRIVAVVAVAGSSWPILMAALLIIRPQPITSAAFAIPLLGMILGNSLNAISLAIDRFRDGLHQDRERVENLLTLGATSWESSREIAADALRVGLLPMINTMTVTGVVSLPGMMTGQLLSGVSPLEAVKYQIVILALIATTTTLGCLLAVWLTFKQSFSKWQAIQRS